MRINADYIVLTKYLRVKDKRSSEDFGNQVTSTSKMLICVVA